MSMDEQRDQLPSYEVTKVIQEALESGSVAVLVTAMTGVPEIGAKLLVEENGRVTGSLGDPELDRHVVSYAPQFLRSRDDTRTVGVKELAADYPTSQEVLLLFERIQPARRLIICGAGHVGAALARLGSFVGYQTTLIDDRADFLDPERFTGEHVELVLATDWTKAVREAVGNGKGVAVAVVTRGHNEDEQCMHAVIRANPDYVGLIGSRRRTTIVIDRLRQAGASEDHLTNIHAPIGLDIGAVSPEEVALAIIAEIVAKHRGGKGDSLSAWRRVS